MFNTWSSILVEDNISNNFLYTSKSEHHLSKKALGNFFISNSFFIKPLFSTIVTIVITSFATQLSIASNKILQLKTSKGNFKTSNQCLVILSSFVINQAFFIQS